MKILVTGGPVHGKLDSVKLITNRFKGGMILSIASDLHALGHEVMFVGPKSMKFPQELLDSPRWTAANHDGFHDYRKFVLAMAPQYDAVVLGGAVANLIPADSWSQVYDKIKFPSHNYKPGEIINVPFVIAPRVIDEVKKEMKPGAHLFGFKLLENVAHEDLIKAAYGVLLESHATAVFANDACQLNQKFAVTKERGVHSLTLEDVAGFIDVCMQDVYYSSVQVSSVSVQTPLYHAWGMVRRLIQEYEPHFVTVENGMKFGTVAWRVSDANYPNSFVTTGRGKRETDDLIFVVGVDKKNHIVTVLRDNSKPVLKATLNAPLLYRIFLENPEVCGIVHLHEQIRAAKTYPYAPPGTDRDSWGDRKTNGSFNIEGHGCFILLGADGKEIGKV